MNKIPLIFLAAALCVPAVAQQKPATAQNEDTVVEEIVARINNSIVTRADLARSRDQMAQELRQQPNVDQQQVAEREKNLLRDLIDQQLLVQKGTDLGISVDTDVIKRLDDLRKEMHADTMEDLEKLAAQQGVSFEDYKQNMKNSLLTQRVIQQEVGGRIQITRDDIQKFYEEHKKDFDLPERIRLSEILVNAVPPQKPAKEGEQPPPPPEPTPEQVAAAEKKANDALAQLKSGKKFEEVARQFSDGPTAQDGGDLGYFKRGVLDKSLEDTTFAMKEGTTTDVIRTKQGFVILKVNEHSQAGLQPISRVEPQIQEAIYYQRIQPALRQFLTKLREDAYIDVKTGYVDTGASPNQTKLVYTQGPEKNVGGKSRKRKKHFLLF